MTTRRGLGLLLLGIGLATSAGTVAGQERSPAVAEPARPSHIAIPGDNAPLDAQKLFEERLRQMDARTADFDKLRKELENRLGTGNMQKLLEEMRRRNILNPNDPRLADQIRQLIANARANGGGAPMNVSPEDIERFKKLLQNAFPDEGRPGTGPQPTPTPGTNPATPPPNPANPHRPMPNPLTGLTGNGPSTGGVDETARAEARQWLEKQLKGMEGFANRLDDSPALQDFLRDLGKSALDMQSSRIPSEERLDTQLAQLHRFAQNNDGWFKDSWRSLRKLDLPNMPRFDMPSSRLPAVGSLPSFRVPQGLTRPPQAPGAWREILTAVGLCLVAVLAWKLLGWGLATRKQRLTPGTWKLGPWPVHPSKVASRDELVQTFEYLSLLRLGYQARTCNHIDIASQLGGTADDRRQAATDLANLYEQARYAPGDEPLPNEALVAARRDLCFLAGMAAS